MMFDGEAFRPLPRFHNVAAAHYGAGEVVSLVPHEDRSKKSHDHFFVTVDEAFNNLPERYTDRWRTSEHLRKWCLVKAGICDERSIVCSSRAEALRVAAFIEPMDQYAVVLPSEAVVTVYTAKSQSKKAMGREAFQASKDAVLAILAGLLDVTPEALSRARAA